MSNFCSSESSESASSMSAEIASSSYRGSTNISLKIKVGLPNVLSTTFVRYIALGGGWVTIRSYIRLPVLKGWAVRNCLYSYIIHEKTPLWGFSGQFVYCPSVYEPKTQFPCLTSAYPYSSDRSRHRPQQSSRSTNEEFSNGADGEWTEYLIVLNRLMLSI